MARRNAVVVLLCVAILITGCGDTAGSPPEIPRPQATPTIAPVPSPTLAPRLRFDIWGVNSYQDAVGSLRFLFEVRNLNDSAVEGVRAQVILRDVEGHIVGSQQAYARLDLLGPGDTAPIMIVFFLTAPEFHTYDVEIEAERADHVQSLLHPSLHVVDDTGRVGQWVPYEVLGLARNAGDSDAESVSLHITCYDEEGTVVAVGSGAPEERTILAGDSSDFLVSLGAVAGQVSNCKVQVEGLVVTND